MELLIFELPEGHPIATPNDAIKDMKLRKAATDGFLGLPAQIHAQREAQIDALFGSKTRNDDIAKNSGGENE